MNTYYFAYYVHVTCVLLSGSFFLLRGAWMLQGSGLLEHRVTRIAPHLVDSALLCAAVVLMLQTGQYPFQVDWLTVKVAALVIYILFGLIALGRGKTMLVRSLFLIMALLTFLFMVSVAVTRHPAGIFSP